jgi:hypothetical protein
VRKREIIVGTVCKFTLLLISMSYVLTFGKIVVFYGSWSLRVHC